MRSLLPTFAFVPLLASCGTLFNGEADLVTFSSRPDGAEVHVNGAHLGRTPCQLSLHAQKDQDVEFRLAGHAPRTVRVASTLEGGWLVLDIVPGIALGLIPLLLDAVTQNWNGLERNHVHVDLDPVRVGG